MPLVIDSSVALTWVMPDEQAETADHLFAGLDEQEVVTPSHFAVEVANALLTNVRKRRISAAYREQALSDVFSFNIRSEPAPSAERLRSVMHLADHHALTAYDAAYLETALRLGASLASLDGDLLQAAEAEGVRLELRG